MNITFATLTAAYEVFVTTAVVVVWEIVLLILKYFPVILFMGTWDPLHPSVWYMTLVIGLIVSFVTDVSQIYYAQEDDEIRSLPIYGVRVATNYVVYAFLVTFMAMRHGFKMKYYTEAQLMDMLGQSTMFQRAVDAVVLDAINISIGRFFITFVEMMISVAARLAERFGVR